MLRYDIILKEKKRASETERNRELELKAEKEAHRGWKTIVEKRRAQKRLKSGVIQSSSGSLADEELRDHQPPLITHSTIWKCDL